MRRLQLLEQEQNRLVTNHAIEISHHIRFDSTDLEEWIACLDGTSSEVVVQAVARLEFVPEVAKVRELTEHDRENNPISFAITISPLTSDGRVLFIADSDEERFEYWVSEKYDLGLLRIGVQLAHLMTEVRNKLQVTSDDVVGHLMKRPAFQGMDTRVLEIVIKAIWEGQPELAVPMLALQFEPVLRNILQRAGQPSIFADERGQQQYKNIDQLLSEPAIVGILGSDLVYFLRYTLSTSRGPQWRHSAAHGYWSIESSNNVVGSVLIYAMLRISELGNC
jgi:hypothetical protein